MQPHDFFVDRAPPLEKNATVLAGFWGVPPGLHRGKPGRAFGPARIQRLAGVGRRRMRALGGWGWGEPLFHSRAAGWIRNVSAGGSPGAPPNSLPEEKKAEVFGFDAASTWRWRIKSILTIREAGT